MQLAPIHGIRPCVSKSSYPPAFFYIHDGRYELYLFNGNVWKHGWHSSGGGLEFPTKEAAVAYCRSLGLFADITPAELEYDMEEC
jgi:hypothetical protein